MFDDKTVFLIVKENHADKIYKVEMDAKTQQNINKIFENSAIELTGKRHREPFADNDNSGS